MKLDSQYMNENEQLSYLRSLMGDDFQAFVDAYVDKMYEEMADAFYKGNLRLATSLYNRIRLILDMLDGK